MSLTLGDSDRKVTKSEIIKTIEDLSKQAIFDNIDGIIDDALDTVALKTGKLRSSVKTSLMNQMILMRTGGVNNIDLSLSEANVSALVAYAKYHWGGESYQNPTTAGTEPILPIRILSIIGKEVQTVILAKLRGAGVVI